MNRLILGFWLCCLLGTTAFADQVEENLQLMLEAARDLEFAEPYSAPGNRAFVLVKTVPLRAPIGVIFGFGDNEAACLEIASDLTAAAASRAVSIHAEYTCDAVY